MNLRPSKKTAVAAARVVLRSIRDSSDGFPPLKSVAAAMMVVWDMNEVRFLSQLLDVTWMILSGYLEGQIEQKGLEAAGVPGHGDCGRCLAANEGLRSCRSRLILSNSTRAPAMRSCSRRTPICIFVWVSRQTEGRSAAKLTENLCIASSKSLGFLSMWALLKSISPENTLLLQCSELFSRSLQHSGELPPVN